MTEVQLKVGQKVVCIDDSPLRQDYEKYLHRPKYNWIYTIRSIMIEPHIPGYGVRLEELINPVIQWSDGDEKEWGYRSERFRPIEEA